MTNTPTTLDTDALLAYLRDWLAHYPEDIFAPPPEFTDERERLLSTIVGAHMGRHVLRRLVADVEQGHPRLVVGQGMHAKEGPKTSDGYLDPSKWSWIREADAWHGPGDHVVEIDADSDSIVISDWQDVAEAPLAIVRRALWKHDGVSGVSDPTPETLIAHGKAEGYREASAKLGRLLGDEPKWHIVFGEVVKLRVRDLAAEGMDRDAIAETVGWPRCDIDTILGPVGDDVTRAHSCSAQRRLDALADLVEAEVLRGCEGDAFRPGAYTRLREAVAPARSGDPCPLGTDGPAFDAAAKAIHVAVDWLLALGADSTHGNASALEKLAAHTVREYAIERGGEIGDWTVTPGPCADDVEFEVMRAKAALADALVDRMGYTDEGCPVEFLGRLLDELRRLEDETAVEAIDAATRCGIPTAPGVWPMLVAVSEFGGGLVWHNPAQPVHYPLGSGETWATVGSVGSDRRPPAPDGLEDRVSEAVKASRPPRTKMVPADRAEEAEARLRALTEKVQSWIAWADTMRDGITNGWRVTPGDLRGWAKRMTDAIADQPDGEARTRHKRSDQAPEQTSPLSSANHGAPTGPGWWWLGSTRVFVQRQSGVLRWRYDDEPGGMWSEPGGWFDVDPNDAWGGPCLQASEGPTADGPIREVICDMLDHVRGKCPATPATMLSWVSELRVGLASSAGPASPAGPAWTEADRVRAEWGDALGLDRNGAPYPVQDLVDETRRYVERLDELSDGGDDPSGAACRRGAVLARFEVVGEVDDKSLRGWTDGDEQESTHDELTFYPDKWDLGTVITVTDGGDDQ